jgi:hypothetical protein
MRPALNVKEKGSEKGSGTVFFLAGTTAGTECRF